MTNPNPQTEITWQGIAKAVAIKSVSDYQTKVKPTVRRGRNKCGSWIEAIGRKLQSHQE